MASPLQVANPGQGTVARRRQTTAKSGNFLESTAKYWMNLYDFSGLPLTTPRVNYPLKAVPGYISRLRIAIIATGGSGTCTAATDSPDAFFSLLRLYDASGYPVYVSDGYGARLITLYGGQDSPGSYADTHARPSFSGVNTAASAGGNFSIVYEIPLELGSGFGCIAGSNQSRIPSLQIDLGGTASLYTAAPATTNPTFEIRVDAEFYGAPLDDPSKAPPGNGSSVQWSMAQAANQISSGSNTGLVVPAPNLTGYLGTLIALARNSTNAREDGWLTGSNDIELWVDSQLRLQETYGQVQDRMAKLFGVGLVNPTGAPTRPVGSAAWSFRDSVLPGSQIGLDNLALWEPTDTGTLLELRSGAWGTVSSGPDTITFYTQRLYPVGDVPYGPEFD